MNELAYIFFIGHSFGILFGFLLGISAGIFYKKTDKNKPAVDMKKQRSLAEKYENALLDIRNIAVSELYREDNTNYLNSLESIHQKAARALWG